MAVRKSSFEVLIVYNIAWLIILYYLFLVYQSLSYLVVVISLFIPSEKVKASFGLVLEQGQ